MSRGRLFSLARLALAFCLLIPTLPARAEGEAEKPAAPIESVQADFAQLTPAAGEAAGAPQADAAAAEPILPPQEPSKLDEARLDAVDQAATSESAASSDRQDSIAPADQTHEPVVGTERPANSAQKQSDKSRNADALLTSNPPGPAGADHLSDEQARSQAGREWGESEASIESAKRILRLEPQHQEKLLTPIVKALEERSGKIAAAAVGEHVDWELLKAQLNSKDSGVEAKALKGMRTPDLKAIEDKLRDLLRAKPEDSGGLIAGKTMELLGSIYAAQIKAGQNPDVGLIRSQLKGSYAVRPEAIQAMGLICAARVERGEPPDWELFKTELKNADPLFRFAVVRALSPIVQAQIQRGQTPKIKLIEDRLNDPDEGVRQEGVRVLGPLYAAMIQHGGKPKVKLLEDKLGDGIFLVQNSALEALGAFYAAQIRAGQPANTKLIDRQLKTTFKRSDFYKEAVKALGLIGVAQVDADQKPDLKPLIEQVENDPITDAGIDIKVQAIRALASIYAALIRKGKSPDLKLLEVQFQSSDALVIYAAAQALGSVHVAQVEQGQTPNLNLLESELENSVPHWVEGVVEPLGAVYAAQAQRGKQFLRLHPNDWSRLQLWLSKNLPYDEKHVDAYFHSSDSRVFIQEMERRAKALIENGFNPGNSDDVWLAFLGTRMAGINVTLDEFRQRVGELAAWDQAHPGSFQSLFSKGKGLPALEVEATPDLDFSQVDPRVLDEHLARLLAIKKRVDSFAWIEQDFPGVKAFALTNIFYQMKRSGETGARRIKEGDRFHVDFPAPEIMRKELLSIHLAYYGKVLQLAWNRRKDPALGPKIAALIRNLMISTALVNGPGDLSSPDLEQRVAAFKNFYQDSIHHFPNVLQMKLDTIKGLQQSFNDLRGDLDEELSKIKPAKTRGDVPVWRIVPQGFLSVFRGRAGMEDCSFDHDGRGGELEGVQMGKGTAYTRALHEDTEYYFAYKGNPLEGRVKGYVGLMWGQTDEGKVLTIDTVNVPALDGETSLTDLFRKLQQLAKKEGAIGVALPRSMTASFNFENRDTIKAMKIYKDAQPIQVKPAHEASWAEFTRIYGPDKYNSIEKGEFKLLPDIKAPPAAP